MTSFAINVIVYDVNDNKPQFERGLYDVTINEMATIGSNVLTVKANDEDKISQRMYYIQESVSNNAYFLHTIDIHCKVVHRWILDGEAPAFFNKILCQ